jgi:hypothetical protein
MLMRYVLPVPRELRGALLAYSRLYAYPVEPEPPPADGFVILDSGAFGLAMAGKHMDDGYISALAAHYERYAADDVLCVAPDEYPNPRKTMENFRSWTGVSVVPVIQFAKKRCVELHIVLRQAMFYGTYRKRLPRYCDRPVVALSNPGLRSHEVAANVWRMVANVIRQFIPNAWLHVLGAGWDAYDIAGWSSLSCFDSIDSIAYYTAAQDGEAWNRSARSTWQQIAVHNAAYAQEIAHRPNLATHYSTKIE